MNRIRIQFSIEWYGQNKVPYGPKHGLYRKNLCQTLFRHETSFPSSKIHETWTIWIGKPFSIDLNDQNQVPIGPYSGLYRILSKIIIFFRNFMNFWPNQIFFVYVRGVFLGPSEGFGTGFGLIRMKKWWIFFFQKTGFSTIGSHRTSPDRK